MELEGRDLLHFDERNVPPERNKKAAPNPRKKGDREIKKRKGRGDFLRTNWVLLPCNVLPSCHFVSTQFLRFADAVPFINISGITIHSFLPLPERNGDCITCHVGHFTCPIISRESRGSIQLLFLVSFRVLHPTSGQNLYKKN